MLWFAYLSLEWSCHDTKIHQKGEDTRKLSSELEMHCAVFCTIKNQEILWKIDNAVTDQSSVHDDIIP